ncbi:MAG: beta galactosidase jelly roll domain-containing protein [Candidatus Dormibacteraeota bacterium]|nr:beta galactosidase jelly roll domain-containing protein [Candidatus Dormibacteraeota bacterium]
MAFQNGAPVPGFQRQTRPVIDLDGSWRWQAEPMNDSLSLGARSRTLPQIERNAGGRQRRGYDDRTWATMTVPGTFNQPPQRVVNGGWYRRTFDVPASWSGQSATLKLGAVNYVADLWLNGHYLGYHEGGSTPFAFNVARWLRIGSPNTLAVRVDNPPWGTRDDIVPWGLADWWNYGGILSDVWLEAANPVHVVRADVTPHLDGADVGFVIANQTRHAARAQVTVEILPAAVTPANLLNPDASSLVPAGAVPVAHGTQRLPAIGAGAYYRGDASFVLRGVDYWSPSSPSLYVARVTVTVDRTTVDQWSDSFGLRQIKVDSRRSRLLLNGQPVAFHGVDLQEQQQRPVSNGSPQGGPVTTPQQALSILQQAQRVGANLIRAGHQPPTYWLPLLADRLGVALWEEIPLYHETPKTFSIAMNRGIPQQMLVEMDLRDMDRASVLFHGFTNESTGTGERESVLTTLRDLDRQVDGTRLTGQAALGSDPTDPTQSPLDVAGFTWYWGVFYGGAPSAQLVARELARAHRANPGKPIMVLEFGYWSDSPGGEAYQAYVARVTYAGMRPSFDTRRGGYLGAAVWWSLNDYWTERPDIGVENFGLYRADGSLRPAGSAIQQAYRTSPGTAAPLRLESGGAGQPAPRGTPRWTVALSAGYALALPGLALLALIGLLALAGRLRRAATVETP